MLDRNPEVDRALAELTPPMRDERGSWERVLADAETRGRARPWWARPWQNRRPAFNPAFAVTIAVALLIVVPALAVAREWWFSSDAPASSGDIAHVRTVRAGDGSTWDLTAYVSRDAGVCVALTPSADSSKGAAMTCGAGVRGEPNVPAGAARHAIGFTVTRGEGTPSFMFGPAATNVSLVEARLSGGRVVTSEAFTGPPSLGAGSLRFYVVEVPPDARIVAVRARDGGGGVLEERAVPERPDPESS